MKVNENNLRVLESSTVYVMRNGELLECEPLETWFAKDQDGYTTASVLKLPNGYTESSVKLNEIYNTPWHYKNQETASFDCFSLTDVKREMFADVVSRTEMVDDTYYTFENGEVVRHQISFSSFNYDYKTNKWKCPEIESNGLTKYATHELACSFNTLKVVDKQGVESEIVGANKLLELTAEQKVLVGQLESIVRQLNEAGVLLIADCSDRYAAYNIKNVEDYALSYEKYDIPEDEQDQYEMIERYAKAFEVKIDYPQWSEDNELFIKRKK